MGLAFNEPLGMRIRYYRLEADMTQKQLAEACGLTEPAIRNYELGNRFPSYETLENIATALNISLYALTDPTVTSFGGVLHVLFILEHAYGLFPVMIDGEPSLQVSHDIDRFDHLKNMLQVWQKAHELVDNGTWSLEDYHTWQSIYPYTTERTKTHPLSIELSRAIAMPQLPEEKPKPPKKKHKHKKKSDSSKDHS